eukprot:CAMPEP_0172763106 /NCGR_PEP_ID=MMETSP1074-20121228/174735_1 /TAXON_ID=2916 /ORGANISM="Ceratium fusus, Strain PA161109" /LENGTH=67 /DNA_ID=CAMNT_0013597625 /DNA_START=85 /DNA_END=285 /DNA_ORIENTATION=-
MCRNKVLFGKLRWTNQHGCPKIRDLFAYLPAGQGGALTQNAVQCGGPRPGAWGVASLGDHVKQPKNS